MTDVRRRLTITGRVQGVAFRWSCRGEADRLGLTGWVQNRPDGSVVAEVQGEQAGVDAWVAWCHEGPPPAAVGSVDVEELELVEEEAGFRIV